ncbi:hypothetical protein CRYUN_Cryun18bG0025300 [Craigia yunnanensis]
MDSDMEKLFVRQISEETNEDKLVDYFNQFGDVLQTMLIRDKFSTRRHRGFGFIVFSDSSLLDSVVKDKHTIDGRTINVMRIRPRMDLETSGRARKLSPSRNSD